MEIDNEAMVEEQRKELLAQEYLNDKGEYIWV
jgi:hypothetical protein